MNNNTLIEDMFPLQHPLMKRLFSDEILKSKESVFGQAIFINYNDPKVIAAKIVQHDESEVRYGSNSVEVLLKYGSDYKSCLMIATCLYDQSLVQIRRILTSSNDVDDNLKQIIGPTNGFILYSYQFEQIVKMILDVPIETAFALRKAFNRKKPLHEYCGIEEEKLARLMAILDRYLAFDCVYTPNYNGATNLYTYVRRLNQ